MELHQLRYFRSVARCENVSKAAEELHVSQPALSRSIKKLEDELGVNLFDREARRVSLNESGEVFLAAVENALNAVDSVGQVLDRHMRDRSSVLNLRGPVNFGDDVGVIAGFKAQHPDIYVRFASEPTPYFNTGVPDLTFFATFGHHEESNYLKLCSEDIVLAVSPEHPLANASSVNLADLADESFVFALPSDIRKVMDGMFVEAGFEPKVVLEDQHCQYLSTYIKQGLGIALMPAITWVTAEARRDLRFIPIADMRRTRHLYLKSPHGVPCSRAGRLFSDYLSAYYRDLVAQLGDMARL